MRTPEAGDVVLRGSTNHGYQIVDAISHRLLGGPVASVTAALELAAQHGATTVWQQSVDNRGRPLGDLQALPSAQIFSVVKMDLAANLRDGGLQKVAWRPTRS